MYWKIKESNYGKVYQYFSIIDKYKMEDIYFDSKEQRYKVNPTYEVVIEEKLVKDEQEFLDWYNQYKRI